MTGDFLLETEFENGEIDDRPLVLCWIQSSVAHSHYYMIVVSCLSVPELIVEPPEKEAPRQHSANRLYVAGARRRRGWASACTERPAQRLSAVIKPPSQGGDTGSNPVGAAKPALERPGQRAYLRNDARECLISANHLANSPGGARSQTLQEGIVAVGSCRRLQLAHGRRESLTRPSALPVIERARRRLKGASPSRSPRSSRNTR